MWSLLTGIHKIITPSQLYYCSNVDLNWKKQMLATTGWILRSKLCKVGRVGAGSNLVPWISCSAVRTFFLEFTVNKTPATLHVPILKPYSFSFNKQKKDKLCRMAEGIWNACWNGSSKVYQVSQIQWRVSQK